MTINALDGAPFPRVELSKWRWVAGSMVALAFGATGSLAFSAGVFMPELHARFGWSRAEIAVASTVLGLAVFFGGNPAGRLGDRFGTRRVATISMILHGLLLMSLPYLVTELWLLWVCYFLALVLGLGTLPMVVLRPIAEQFGSTRGIAFGLALCGTGLGSVIVPVYANLLVERGGLWLAWTGLGVMSLCAAPLLWLIFPSEQLRPKVTVSSGNANSNAPGIPFAQAIRTGRFWMLSLISVLAGTSVGIVYLHLVPLLREGGASAAGAASIASLLGIASITGRLAGGFGADKIRGPALGAAILCVGALGCLLVGTGPGPATYLGVVLIGLALGSETDILAYFVSRYFGHVSFSAIYGWQYGVVCLGGAVGPTLGGALRDWSGTYTVTLGTCFVFFLLSGILSLLLGPYRFEAHGTNRESGAN